MKLHCYRLVSCHIMVGICPSWTMQRNFWIVCKKVHAAFGGPFHMALTSDSIRYDQDAWSLSTKILLQRITSCTVMERKFWNYLAWKQETINIVSIHTTGTRHPTAYAGINEARQFQKLVVKLQARCRNATPSVA